MDSPGRCFLSAIRFGTDGWRAPIARGFTFRNLRRLVQAASDHFQEQGAALTVVGYDRRFLARRAAEEVAGVLLANGFQVRLSDRPEPTPAVSCQVVEAGAAFGLVITASHNPPEFLGLKIKTARGASAPPEVTAAIESRLDRVPPRFEPPEHGIRTGRLTVGGFAPAHLGRLARMVDLPRIRASRLQVVLDAMHGAAANRLDDLLADSSVGLRTIRAEVDPLFGGMAPEPTRDRLGPLQERMRRGGMHLGFATDGDGDRIAAVDDGGAFVSPLRLVAVLALHLIRRRRMPGGIAKTFANTIYLDRIAAAEGRPFHCLPVGFKHVAALLEQDALVIGGEESGGMGFRGYLPERDGLLAGLLLMEAVAMAGAPLSELVAGLAREFGDYHYDRLDLALGTGEPREALSRLAASPPDRVAGLAVRGIDTRDGVKLLLGDEGWLLLRASGTEPVLRVYTEARSPGQVEDLLRAGRRLCRELATPG